MSNIISPNYLSATNTDFQQSSSLPFTPELSTLGRRRNIPPADFTCYYRYRDPRRRYTKGPAQCAVNPIVLCPPGSRYFRDQCGCGCIISGRTPRPYPPYPAPRPVRPIYACPREPIYCVPSPTCGYAVDGRRGNFSSVCQACGHPLTSAYSPGFCGPVVY